MNVNVDAFSPDFYPIHHVFDRGSAQCQAFLVDNSPLIPNELAIAVHLSVKKLAIMIFFLSAIYGQAQSACTFDLKSSVFLESCFSK